MLRELANELRAECRAEAFHEQQSIRVPFDNFQSQGVDDVLDSSVAYLMTSVQVNLRGVEPEIPRDRSERRIRHAHMHLFHGRFNEPSTLCTRRDDVDPARRPDVATSRRNFPADAGYRFADVDRESMVDVRR